MKVLITPAKQEVLTKWVQQYSDALYSWAFHKTSDQKQAEDLVQDTFMAAQQAFHSFEEKSSARTWLFSILNHKIIDYYRKKSRNPLAGPITLDAYGEDHLINKVFDQHGNWVKEYRPQDWQEDDPQLLDDGDFRQTLQGCMQKLPSAWSSTLQLKYLNEKEGKEICQDLGISTSNYWQILHRAKLQLRHCLEHHWFKK